MMNTDKLNLEIIKVVIQKFFLGRPAAWNTIKMKAFLNTYNIEERKAKIADRKAIVINSEGNRLSADQASVFLERCEFEFAEEKLFSESSSLRLKHFVLAYSNGIFTIPSQELIKAFERLIQCRTLSDFALFKKDHPDHCWLKLTNERMATYIREFFQEAKKSLVLDRIALQLEDFIKQFEGTPLAAEALSLIKELEYYSNQNTFHELQDYLHRYPYGLFIDEAQKKIEGLRQEKGASISLNPQLTSDEVREIKVFLSYAREDSKYRKQLAKHLKTIKKVKTWDDLMIDAGDTWETEIDNKINDADIVVVLVSADFIASDFCKKELTRAKEMKKIIIPVILRPCLWKIHEIIGSLNALPVNGTPVANYRPNRDAAFAEIAEGINKVIQRIP